MKIMMVSDMYYPKIDGIVTSVTNSALMLADKGHEIALVVPYSKNAKVFNKKNLYTYFFKSFPFYLYPDLRVAAPDIFAMMKIIKGFDPDVIHIHTPGTLGIIAMIVGKRQKKPIINTYHTSLPDIMVYASPVKIFGLDKFMTNTLAVKTENERLVWIRKNIKKNFSEAQKKMKIVSSAMKKISRRFSPNGKEPMKLKTLWTIIRRYYNNSDLIIVPSDRIRLELEKHEILPEIKVNSNGIELDKFTAKQSYHKFPKFLHIGRIGYEKRIDVVIRAMKIVIKKYPSASLTVVGDGPALKLLKKQVLDLGLSRHITFTGFLPRENLPDIYRDHDVFVTASEMETQGIVLLESMACGLPVIGVDVLAIPEVVHSDVNGFLARKGNNKEIAKFMCHLIEHPELLPMLGKNARIEAEKHDLTAANDNLEKIYCLLADKKKNIKAR